MEKSSKAKSSNAAKQRGKVSRIITELLATAFSLPNGAIPDYDDLEAVFYDQIGDPLQFSQNK